MTNTDVRDDEMEKSFKSLVYAKFQVFRNVIFVGFIHFLYFHKYLHCFVFVFGEVHHI